jgi:hypothetical protein
VTGIFNLVLSVLLVGPLGPRGVALGTLIPTVIEILGFVLPYTLWVLRIHPVVLARQAVVPALAPAIPAWAALLFIRNSAPLSSWLALGLAGLTAALLYGACYFVIGSRGVEKELARSLAHSTIALARLWVRRRRLSSM